MGWTSIEIASRTPVGSPTNPLEVTGGQWKTADFESGDVIVFDLYTMHASTMNLQGRAPRELRCPIPAGQRACRRALGRRGAGRPHRVRSKSERLDDRCGASAAAGAFEAALIHRPTLRVLLVWTLAAVAGIALRAWRLPTDECGVYGECLVQVLRAKVTDPLVLRPQQRASLELVFASGRKRSSAGPSGGRGLSGASQGPRQPKRSSGSTESTGTTKDSRRSPFATRTGTRFPTSR